MISTNRDGVLHKTWFYIDLVRFLAFLIFFFRFIALKVRSYPYLTNAIKISKKYPTVWSGRPIKGRWKELVFSCLYRVHSRYTRMAGFGRREIELMQALCIYNRYIECYSVTAMFRSSRVQKDDDLRRKYS